MSCFLVLCSITDQCDRGSTHIYCMAKSVHVQDLSPGKCLFRIDNRACPIHCLSGVISAWFLVIGQAGLYLKGREGRKEEIKEEMKDYEGRKEEMKEGKRKEGTMREGRKEGLRP